MKVLVVGSGGREHALTWKIAQSERVEKIYAAPGNPGMAELATCLDIKADDIDRLLAAAKKHAIDLTVVGPEIPLVAGIVDRFKEAGLRIWGPSKAASELEGSKVAMKEFLRRYNIPTASFKIFNHAQSAHAYLDEVGAPIVIKCDGLAAGKGVTVAATVEEAHEAVTAIMERQVFGAEAGKHVVIEEAMRGEEISMFAFCDGHNAVLCDLAQDHKQAFDGDKGPNTGGMGAFTPAPGLVSEKDEDEIVRRILVPTLNGLVHEERPYVGILYIGLMLTEAGPKVVEYNVRFGDPECQPLMLRLKSDLVEVLEACVDGTLDKVELDWTTDTAICITMASGGYPGNYASGKAITGLDNPDVQAGATVFHAGTALKNDELVTAGGRVLSVCALGSDVEDARAKVYPLCKQIAFAGAHYRSDIGRRHG
ncbi:MAG: phosphoribosylamine--glycine ligase [Planctomycetota bacterium]|jgi:phosphoribosylamine--glycine ligase|nr:phosphoribosylamine--glycine ligase [Planctomycetota bacterium]